MMAAVPLLATAVDYAAEGKLWWAHVQFLADDKLQGRYIGTDQFRQAAEYVSGQFQRLGLEPAGTSGYRQPVQLQTRQVIAEESSLALVREGSAEPLALGTDATLSARADLAPNLEAPMVFVGYGLVIPEAHWDELAGLDLKGKIAVYVSAPGPAEAPAPVKSHLAAAAERWKVLRNAGAVGIATIGAGRGGAGGSARGGATADAGNGDAAVAGASGGGAGAVAGNADATAAGAGRRSADRGGASAVPGADAVPVGTGRAGASAVAGANAAPVGTGRGTGPGGAGAAAGNAGAGGGRGAAQPAVSLADPALSETSGMAVAVTITPHGAEKFFAGSGHTFAEIQQLVRDNRPLPRFPLNASLRSHTALKHASLESANLAGMAPGSGKWKNEYVILSAHLDHVGVGRPVNGDSIYNGAMDDASGIATLIEVARLLKESKARLRRSVLFLAVTGEEEGELGSQYFAAHPTVPFQQIVADINLDMFLPLYPLKVIEVQGLMESTLGDTVKAAAKADGVDVQIDQEPAENRFIRSDQYSFIRRGIPSLAFKFGYQPGSPDETTRKNWIRDRYHKPSDDLSQPVDTAAAARFDRIILRLLETVANDKARPQWRQDSFFRRFAVADNAGK